MAKPQRKKFLHKLYWDKEMSLHEIEKFLKINYSTIRYHFEYLKIPFRKRLKALEVGRNKRTGGHSFNWKGDNYVDNTEKEEYRRCIEKALKS